MTLTLDEIYIKTEAFIVKLRRIGYPDSSELVLHAIRGGSTSNEILLRIDESLYYTNEKLRTENELLAFEARQLARSINEFFEEFHGMSMLTGAVKWYD